MAGFLLGFFWCVATQLWWQAALIAAGSLAFVATVVVASLYAPDLLEVLDRLGKVAGFVEGSSREEAVRVAPHGVGSQAPESG